MNVVLISSRFAPETSPGAKRATDLSAALVAARHDVTVLTQMPNYPDPAAFDYVAPRGRSLEVVEESSGCTIWRYKPTLVEKRRLLRRLATEARFAARVSKLRTRLSDVDGVVASTPFVFNLPAARTYRRPMWLDVRDLTWEYARDLAGGSSVKRLGASALRSIALANLRRAARVSTTTESQRQYLISHGLPAQKVTVIPNGVPRRVVEALGERSIPGAKSTERDGAPMRVVYAGLLGFPQGLRFAVESVGALGDDGVELHLFGDGVDHEKLKDYCRTARLRQVHFHGHVGYEEYLDAIATADVLLASLRTEVTSAMPSKIWEYMAAGKPVLFAGSGEAAEAIAVAAAGASVEYGDRRRFQERLRELSRDEALRRQLGANGREWVMRHRIREEINRSWVEQIEEAFEDRKVRARHGSTAATDKEAPQAGDGTSAVPVASTAPTAPARSVLKGSASFAAWSAERAGLLKLAERMAGGRPDRLAVLTYHRIAEDFARPRPSPGLVSATPAAFAQQMAHVAANYNVVSTEDVLRAVRADEALPARAVLLTFDDAYCDFAEQAWPVLRRHGLPVTLFVPTGFPGHSERSFWWDRLFRVIEATQTDSCSTPFGECALQSDEERLQSFRFIRDAVKRLPHREAMEVVDRVCAELGDDHEPASEVLDWDALRSLASGGVTLGAHTRTHPLLDQIQREEIRSEVSGSLTDLKREIGDVLPIFAYPAGHASDAAVQVLAEEGIELAFTTRGGVNIMRRGVDALQLRRIHVGPRTTRPILRAQILGLRPPRWLRTA